MKKILIIIIFTILAVAAGWIIISRQPEKNTLRTECFEEVFSDGSVIQAKFSFDNNNTTASGTLDYLWAYKDNSTGTFIGTIKNNVIFGNYHFFSEEVWSDSQVAFLYDGQSLVPGYGELTTDGTGFVNPDSLTFDPKNKLIKTACPLAL
jgi:hypothetical protein